VRIAEEPNYLDLHLTPNDAELWKLERFPEFIEEHKKLIRQQFAYLLAPAARSTNEG
jgi:hypothetical protein